MVFRRDLVEHFEWLEGSQFYDEALDESLIAITLCAYDLCGAMVQNGAGAWSSADYVVHYFRLEEFVERVRSERLR